MNEANGKLIYVAGPFTSPTEEGRKRNIDRANAVGLRVIELGGVPLIPHTLYGPMFGLISESKAIALDMRWLRLCDAVILCNGWEQSKGTVEEVIAASDADIPVFNDVAILRRFIEAGHIPASRMRHWCDDAIIYQALRLKRENKWPAREPPPEPVWVEEGLTTPAFRIWPVAADVPLGDGSDRKIEVLGFGSCPPSADQVPVIIEAALRIARERAKQDPIAKISVVIPLSPDANKRLSSVKSAEELAQIHRAAHAASAPKPNAN